MFKLTSSKHGTYYCRTRADAEALRETRKRHNESGYRIVELVSSTPEQRKLDHITAMRSD